MAALTDIGKLLRKLRIDKGERLLDMAAYLNVSSSFLSAVEVGHKAPPVGIEEQVIGAYDLDEEAAEELRNAADRSRTSFIMRPESELARDTAGLLARRINTLTSQDLEEIQLILKKREK